MIRMAGACLIVAGCGGFGCSMAAANRREERDLAALIQALEYMSCELSCRMTVLPELCREVSALVRGTVSVFFGELAKVLERRSEPDVQVCVYEAMQGIEGSRELRRLLGQLGGTLGRFDLPGQLRGIEGSLGEAEQSLRRFREGAAERRRSYQTLGLCAGAALAILFL